MTKYINIHTHQLSHNDEVIDCLTYNNGVHPWKACEDYTPLNLQEWYIGEIGLDKKCSCDYEVQKEVFSKQLGEIGSENHSPIFIHSVKAHQDILLHLKKYNIINPIIFHGFIGNIEEAKQILDQGHYLSYGVKTFASKKTQDALKATPMERLFLETDTSEKNIIEIYDFASNLKKIDISSIKESLYNNYKEILDIA